VAGFISEWWPTSNRKHGRLQIGIGGRIESEFAKNMNKPVNLTLAAAEAVYAAAKAKTNAALLDRFIFEKRAARSFRSYKRAIEYRRWSTANYHKAVEALEAAGRAVWAAR
jgi:hypothetical protein